MCDNKLPRLVKLKSFEVVGEVIYNKPKSDKAKPMRIYKVKCPYCSEVVSNRFIKTHLNKVHNISLKSALKELNGITEEIDKCVLCSNKRDIELHDKLNPLLRPTCSKCSMKYGKTLQTETLKSTIDPESGKTLMELRMEKQFSTMKNTIDPETRKDNFELYLERVERSTRTQAKQFRNTELYYRSSNELDFFNDNYELLGLIKSPTIKKYYKNSYYSPDAYIPSTNTIVEIKSTGVMMVRQSPLEVYLKFKKAIELNYNILFVLDYNEIRFSNLEELDKFFDKYF